MTLVSIEIIGRKISFAIEFIGAGLFFGLLFICVSKYSLSEIIYIMYMHTEPGLLCFCLGSEHLLLVYIKLYTYTLLKCIPAKQEVLGWE